MKLTIYNSLSGQKEEFKPIHEGRVGMYVCGPTVYSDVHLGNCRTFVNFDVIYRYLLHLGYKVRYVRNITDVGHLVDDSDALDAEDKIAKKARLEQIQPMEVVQKYTNGFHDMMAVFNTLPPSIEPTATGHIPEQIDMVQEIIDRGFAYEQNGSVYFDVPKFHKETGIYGKLSGRVLDDLIAESRELKKQDEKRNPADFAIWMKASPEHILRWKSPWSVGFPGWHLECSVMSTKYLGQQFDIHGGGQDLKFPHHENEIAQNFGACHCIGANYWLHANMLLLNGKKMSKSDGNNITPAELFTGNSTHVSKGYTAMIARFFFLQAHYGSTLDMNDDALLAAEKGYKRLMEAHKILQNLDILMVHPDKSGRGGDNTFVLDKDMKDLMAMAYEDMNDNFNAPKALSRLFELASKINGLKGGQLSLKDVSLETLTALKKMFSDFIVNIFGLKDDSVSENGHATLDGVMNLVIDLRAQARSNKDFATSDKIRDGLKEAGVLLKDSKEGTTWVKE